MADIVGYPTPGKGKALQLVSAFCAGAGGEVVKEIPKKLLPGAAVFYGVTAATAHLWEQAKTEGRDWYYIDNAYFDSCREKYFRVTKNALQHHGCGQSNGRRFAALNLEIKPWRESGKHVLLCPQSDEFMRVCAGYSGSWIEDTLLELRRVTQRELRVRPWARDKAKWYATLPDDLKDCHALVTYSSASAVSALLAGVPALATSKDCISHGVALCNLQDIEEPPPVEDDRYLWMQVVADNQWTLDELRSGAAWMQLHGVVQYA